MLNDGCRKILGEKKGGTRERAARERTTQTDKGRKVVLKSQMRERKNKEREGERERERESICSEL